VSTISGAGQRDGVSSEKEREDAASRVTHPQAASREPGETPKADAASRTRTVLELLALVATPTTLLIALAFYFGWKLTESRAAYFGIDYSTLGFSTQDYLLRSADALYVPLGGIVVAGLVALAAHMFVSDCLTHGRRLQLLHRLVPAMAAIGAVLFVTGAYGVFRQLPFEIHYLFVPLSPGFGIVLLAYAGYVHDRLASLDSAASATGPRLSPGSVGIVLISLFVVLSLFWATSLYATALGRGRAERLAVDLSSRPGVVVYSEEQLGLSGPGVIEEALAETSSVFGFRYGGLRLLIRTDDKYFLLPDGWTRSIGTVIVLPDAAGLRFEFTVGE
jgi:hypothetical protein